MVSCKSPDGVTVLSVTSLQSSFLDLVFCDRRAAYFSVLLHLFAKGGAQEICPSLRTMLSLVRLLWCFYFGRLVFIQVTGPLYINEKVRFSIYWESFFKGWPLCLPLHPNQMLQTNIYVCSRLFSDVYIVIQVIQAQAFSRSKWETFKNENSLFIYVVSSAFKTYAWFFDNSKYYQRVDTWYKMAILCSLSN